MSGRVNRNDQRNALPQADLPDSPHARQLKAGFVAQLRAPLESEYRQTVLEEHLPYIRVNLPVVLAIACIGDASLNAGDRSQRRSRVLRCW